MATNGSISSHVEIRNLNVMFGSEGEPEPARQVFLIRTLHLRLSREGLDQLLAHLISNVRLGVVFAQSAGGEGVDLIVQAALRGFRPRVRIGVRLHGDLPGGIRIELSPGSRWSPLDWTMLRIVRGQLDNVVNERAEIVETGTRTYLVDLQALISELLLEQDAPVRWQTGLREIQSTSDDLNLIFEEAVPSGR